MYSMELGTTKTKAVEGRASSSLCSGTRGDRLAPLSLLSRESFPSLLRLRRREGRVAAADDGRGFRQHCPCATGKATGPAFGTAGS